MCSSDLFNLTAFKISNNITRKKRNIFTPIFSYITGLATEEEVEKIHANEQAIVQAENSIIDKIQEIQSQSSSVVQNIQIQNNKLAKLFNDEAEIKTSIKSLLSDTNDALQQISRLTAALEIFSDIDVEYQAFFALLNLVPHLINDVRQSITALTTQSITETLLPAEDLSLKIPRHHRASLLSGQISAAISGDKFLLIVTLPEYLPAFTLYKIRALPFNPTPPDNYNVLKIENDLVAMNNDLDTFIYNPSICITHKTINMCPFHMLAIKHRPTTCSEALVTKEAKYIDLCLKSAAITKPTSQSFIYMENLTKIRIFSPFPDSLSHICGSIIQTNMTEIKIGYTDKIGRAHV